MWYLVAADKPDLKYVLLVGREYSVGRKDCDILLTTDPTVSRKHSVLQLTHTESNLSHPQKSALVTLKDVSKFGTWVNKKRVSGETLIRDGDEVAFGSPKSVFLVVNEPFIITTSCLDVASKKSAKAVVRTFGGHVVSEWTKNCSLLVMSSISVTIKVICAMITQKSIVLPSYLEKLLEHLKGEGEKPDPDVYLPTVSETQVNPEEVSFKPNPNRASVFKGMKFIFLSQRQFKKMNLAVELAGGMPILMEEGSDDNDDRVLVESGTVVMNCGADDLKTLTAAGQEWVAHVNKYLKRKKKNVIQDAEIGYAILYCSTEKHCNPDIDKAQQLFQNVPSQSLSQSVAEHPLPDVLVANTETSPGRRRGKDREITGDKSMVDESIIHAQTVKVKQEVVGQTAATPTKRKRTADVREDEATETQELKRIKQEVVTPAKSQTQRRSRLDGSPRPDQDVRAARQPKQGISPEQESVAKGRGRRSPSPAVVKNPPSRAKSRSPSPSPSRRSTRGNKTSPAREVVVKEEDALPSNTGSGSSRGKGKKSPSPKPTKSQRVKDELFEELDDDFDMSVKTPAGISGRKSQHSHVLSDEDIEEVQTYKAIKKEKETKVSKVLPKTSPSSKTNKRVLLDDSDEEDLGLWQGRPRGQKQTSRGDDSGGFMDILSSKQKKHKSNTSGARGSNDEDNLFDDIPSTRTNTARSETDRQERVAGQAKRGSRQKSPSPTPSRRSKREKKDDSEEETLIEQTRVSLESRRQNTDVVEVSEEEPDTATETRDSSRNDHHDNRTVPRGFLTTRLPIKEQTVKREDFIKEEDKPTAVVVTQFTSLVARQPKPLVKKSGKKDIPDGYTEWNGKLVKNFKRFKKSSHAGANFLPRIIGGSDLVEHMGSQRRELDDWFKDALQAESQENEREREAQDLFNWEPTSRSKRSR